LLAFSGPEIVPGMGSCALEAAPGRNRSSIREEQTEELSGRSLAWKFSIVQRGIFASRHPIE
jgi:hypothetical protein